MKQSIMPRESLYICYKYSIPSVLLQMDNNLLSLPPPDRSVFMQSPPPETVEAMDIEGAPSSAGPIDFKVDRDSGGRIVYKPKAKYFKAPTIIIEGAAN